MVKFKVGDKIMIKVGVNLKTIGFDSELPSILTIKKIEKEEIWVEESSASYFLEKEIKFANWRKRYET